MVFFFPPSFLEPYFNANPCVVQRLSHLRSYFYFTFESKINMGYFWLVFIFNKPNTNNAFAHLSFVFFFLAASYFHLFWILKIQSPTQKKWKDQAGTIMVTPKKKSFSQHLSHKRPTAPKLRVIWTALSDGSQSFIIQLQDIRPVFEHLRFSPSKLCPFFFFFIKCMVQSSYWWSSCW